MCLPLRADTCNPQLEGQLKKIITDPRPFDTVYTFSVQVSQSLVIKSVGERVRMCVYYPFPFKERHVSPKAGREIKIK